MQVDGDTTILTLWMASTWSDTAHFHSHYIGPCKSHGLGWVKEREPYFVLRKSKILVKTTNDGPRSRRMFLTYYSLLIGVLLGKSLNLTELLFFFFSSKKNIEFYSSRILFYSRILIYSSFFSPSLSDDKNGLQQNWVPKGSVSFIEHKQTCRWAWEQRTKLNLRVHKKFTELQSAKQKYKRVLCTPGNYWSHKDSCSCRWGSWCMEQSKSIMSYFLPGSKY